MPNLPTRKQVLDGIFWAVAAYVVLFLGYYIAPFAILIAARGGR